MRKAVTRYQNFQKNKDEFEEEFEKLKSLRAKIQRRQSLLDEAKQKIAALEQTAKGLNSERSARKEALDNIRIDLDLLRRTRRKTKERQTKS